MPKPQLKAAVRKEIVETPTEKVNFLHVNNIPVSAAKPE